jgi:hypothetical protein
MEQVVGQFDMHQQANQHENDQQDLIKSRVESHGAVPFSSREKETILPYSAALQLSLGIRYRTRRSTRGRT